MSLEPRELYALGKITADELERLASADIAGFPPGWSMVGDEGQGFWHLHGPTGQVIVVGAIGLRNPSLALKLIAWEIEQGA